MTLQKDILVLPTSLPVLSSKTSSIFNYADQISLWKTGYYQIPIQRRSIKGAQPSPPGAACNKCFSKYLATPSSWLKLIGDFKPPNSMTLWSRNDNVEPAACILLVHVGTISDVLAAIALTRLIGEIGDVFASFSQEHFGLDPHWDVYTDTYTHICVRVCVCVCVYDVICRKTMQNCLPKHDEQRRISSKLSMTLRFNGLQ